MILGHGMVNRDEMLILYVFYGDAVVIICFLRFQRGQSNAAAADNGAAGAMDDIAAEGTDIELAPQHIGGDILIADMLSVHQLNHRDSQSLRQRLQQRDIRQSLCRFPLGDGFATDTDSFPQVCLGQVPFFTQLPDGISGDISIHSGHFLSDNSIADRSLSRNLRSVDQQFFLNFRENVTENAEGIC